MCSGPVTSLVQPGRGMLLAVHPELESTCIHVHLNGQNLACFDPPSSLLPIMNQLAVLCAVACMKWPEFMCPVLSSPCVLLLKARSPLA